MPGEESASSDDSAVNLFCGNDTVEEASAELQSVDESHYHEVKTLYMTFFKSKAWRSYAPEIAEALCQLPESTDIAVIDTAAAALCSLVPLRLVIDKDFARAMLRQLRRFLSGDFIRENSIALVYSLRYVNMPAEVAVALYDSLNKNYDFLQSDEYSEEMYSAKFFRCDYFVLFSKCKATDAGQPDLQTLYNIELYDFKSKATKVFTTTRDRFDPDYEFNVWLLLTRNTFKQVTEELK